MNVARSILETCVKYGSKPAVVFEEKIYTFADIDRHVRLYASMLHEMGLQPGDRVAIQLPKSMEFVFLHLAVMLLGGCSLPLNPDYKPDEIDYFLSDSSSSFFFTDGDRFSRARSTVESASIRVVIVDEGITPEVETLEEALKKAQQDFEPSYETDGNDTAVICYTSGTTGRSKGAMITHRNLISNMLALKEAWGITDQDVLLHMLPLFHVHGLFVALQGALHAGCITYMRRKFDPAAAWKMIQSERCSLFMGVPTMYQRLTDQWDEMDESPDLSSMRIFISGSAPLMENNFHWN